MGPESQGSVHTCGCMQPSLPHAWAQWHLPCQVQAPQKHHQLEGQVGHKERVVTLPHAVLHPGAVMVIAADTAAAVTTVPGPEGLLLAQGESRLNT